MFDIQHLDYLLGTQSRDRRRENTPFYTSRLINRLHDIMT